MNLIAAVDDNWGIGYKGGLLFRIPEDMKYFKEKTLGKVVVMGRGTFESLPGKKPLKDRMNIIFSASLDCIYENVVICRSTGELVTALQGRSSDNIFIIGGESIFSQLLPYCSVAYITKVIGEYRADKYLTNLDEQERWIVTARSDIRRSDSGIYYYFLTYKNTVTCKMS